MKFELWSIGKTKENYLSIGESEYEKRLKHYISFLQKVWPQAKLGSNATALDFKRAEAHLILSNLTADDFLVLLDEKGMLFTSVGLSEQVQKWMNRSMKKIVFLIGGAYGFDESIYERANAQLALSKLTFTHQMVRLVFLEQLYRTMTILSNESYHNS
jgi:23S rRNA (pseudouridine1915-N3)-methyltransferase